MKLFWQSFRMLLVLAVITGVIYPLLVTIVGQVVFPLQANGSLLTVGGTVVGSSLIGQANDDPRYFWSRPSTVNYMQGTSPDSLGSSGATNLSSTSAKLAADVAAQEASFRAGNNLSAEIAIPDEMLHASASGLDPHISPEAARLQVERVALARGIPVEAVSRLVEQGVTPPQLGFLGEPTVNVLQLNLALDALPPTTS
jgi:K+-transporting ATPase ATPase C chain